MTLGISVAEIVEKSNNPLLRTHSSWCRVRLDAVAEILNGFAFESSQFTKSEGVPLLRIRDIGKNTTEAFYSGPYDEAYFVKPGDLIIGMDGDFNCANWRGPRALLNQRVCKVTVTSPEYNSKFLEFVLPGYLKAINDLTSSVTVKHLSSKTVGEIPLPCPPLPEQERIVARLEELLSDLEAGVAALERVRAGAKRYKSSVLKAAVEGDLTPGPSPKGRGEPRGLPEGWRWVTVEEIGNKNEQTVLTGPFGTNLGREDFAETGIPVLTIGCLTEYGLNLEKAKYISDAKAKDLEKYRVREGDLLFSRMAIVGRAGLVTRQFDGIVFNYHLMRLRLDCEMIDPYYFLFYVRGSSTVTNYVKEVNHGATRDGINTEQLLGLPVALPPLEEQRRIVREVEWRLESARAVEAAVEVGLKRAKRLRQAVLRSAFEGRL